MKVEEINALRELDRAEVIQKARGLGIKLPPDPSGLVTTDSVRISIIEKLIADELASSPTPSTETYRQALCKIADGAENAVEIAQEALAAEPV